MTEALWSAARRPSSISSGSGGWGVPTSQTSASGARPSTSCCRCRGAPIPKSVRFAAREFAKIEFTDHRYVMVLHDHQANPHVHLAVKAESKHGKRLNPRKADLRRWREVFAEQLRERGIDAEASRQLARGPYRKREELWQVKAREEGRLRVHSEGDNVRQPCSAWP